ncbi:MAG: 16S rRNA (guanine(527)-N(7))-methyltransferase RsmG [Gemmobacter sp.]|jgi:16S rRNA (guanine527-N7)-methyltransferase|nr:16S rRNA (guanine(527)-N(7))-methyltransferase RsmG [Gemmobacter sp.]
MTDDMTELAGVSVSRETIARLERYCALLTKWNATINLVAKAALPSLWERHILDSLQIARHLPERPVHWVDLGSGGGLPGLIVAIVAVERDRGSRFTLVEADHRKCAFLLNVIHELKLPALVRSERIEEIEPLQADILSARALASLDILCGYASRHLAEGGVAIFPKGERASDEITEAGRNWRFALEVIPSVTNSQAGILKLQHIHHV